MRVWPLSLAVLLFPSLACAHAGGRAVILTLPTAPAILGAGMAVAATALLAARARQLPAMTARAVFERPAFRPDLLFSWCGALAFLGLCTAGVMGSRDPLENPLPLVVWTLVWVGLTILQALCGDVWHDLNPWRGPVIALRRLLRLTEGVGLGRLGHWPAVLFFFLFAWFEIVFPAPEDPGVLAAVAGGYGLLILILAVLEGEEWLTKGEFLTVFFGFVAKISPLWAQYAGDRVQVMAGWPGARISQARGLDRGQVAFLTLAIGSVTFDGLHQTFRWVDLIGFNPLDYPGRTAVMGPNTLGLIATWGVTAALVSGAVAMAGGAAGLTLCLLPIAAAYHIAHYLTALLTQGQYAIAALFDPFHSGHGLWGLDEDWVSFGFLGQVGPVRAIWLTQVALIVGAHVLAVLLAEQAQRGEPAPRPFWAGLPLTGLMTLYTCFGLWLLAAPAIS